MIDLDFRKKKFVLNYDVTQFKVDFLNDFVGIHAAQFDFVYIIIMMVRFVKITIEIWGGKIYARMRRICIILFSCLAWEREKTFCGIIIAMIIMCGIRML